MPITTPAEVETLTGTSVTAGEVALAEAVVEVYAGRSPLVWEHLSAGDLRTLKLAVAFEAVWLRAHPEALGSMDVESTEQLDQSVTPRGAGALTLAPLAARTLRRLSWRGVRSIPVRTVFQHSGAEDDVSDSLWSPLP